MENLCPSRYRKQLRKCKTTEYGSKSAIKILQEILCSIENMEETLIKQEKTASRDRFQKEINNSRRKNTRMECQWASADTPRSSNSH